MPISVKYFEFLAGKKTERVALPERYFLSFTNRRFLVGESELFLIQYPNLMLQSFQYVFDCIKIMHLDSAI